jgi:8-oxo-dGTP diphosphatase
MKPIGDISDIDVTGKNIIAPLKYNLREAVRIILYNKDKIALLNVRKDNYHKLPGGGVEKGEDLQQSLKREVLEETGCKVEDIKELGEIVEYRNEYALKQTSYCYTGKLKGKTGKNNLTETEKKAGFKLQWTSVKEAISLLEKENPKDYTAKFIVKRDLKILQSI